MVGGSFGKGIFRCVKLCCGSKVGGARKMSAFSSPPWLMLPPALEGGDMVDKFYDVAENKVLSLKKRSSGIIDNKLEIKGSSHGWLCLFNQRNCDMFLANPVSGRHIKLPFINCLPIPEENLKSGHGCVSKVIISGSPDEEEEECRAMMIYGTADSLAFCCPGRSREWTPIGAAICPNIPFNRARGYEDFVYSSRHKQFFCLTEIDSDDLEGWDLSNPRSPRLDWLDEELLTRHYDPWFQLGLEPTLFTRPLRYLVFAEESDQLYMVTRHLVEQMDHNGSIVEGLGKDYPCKTIGFSVHKIDREGGKLVLMEGSLDGLTIFVGLNHSFATSSSEFPHLKPNSIYFTTDRLSITPEWVDSKYGGHDIGIFDYEKRTISPCYYPCDVQSFKRIMPAPIWFIPTHP